MSVEGTEDCVQGCGDGCCVCGVVGQEREGGLVRVVRLLLPRRRQGRVEGRIERGHSTLGRTRPLRPHAVRRSAHTRSLQPVDVRSRLGHTELRGGECSEGVL